MSAHVLLNLLNESGEKGKMRGFAKHLIGFPPPPPPPEFNKFNNTGARMQDSIYHMILKSHLLANSSSKHRDVFMNVNA